MTNLELWNGVKEGDTKSFEIVRFIYSNDI